MPPRLDVFQRLGTVNLCLRPTIRTATPAFLPTIQAANLSSKEKKRIRKQDPYKYAQAQLRKNANLKRRADLKEVRDEAWGDPIRGKTTPYVESFDTAGQAGISKVVHDGNGEAVNEAHEVPAALGMRNHGLTDAELEDGIKHAYALGKPMFGAISSQITEGGAELSLQRYDEEHAKAVEALRRITSLRNSSAKDRHHANVRRIIEEFGRHNTDKVLAPKPPSINPNTIPKPDRSGPDTGSSEVQIAILTAKIRALKNALDINKGWKDYHNKRNLSLLIHRRQKLLAYMERKERGSGRWTNLLEKLGLTPATWKGEITVNHKW
ncbi:hypothetical protein E4U15_001385 [Claviceps sp. LM218 group G6]|nr:hypothetical protein E4U15_001385 [Claviceps sp. LM218 group G6]